MRKGIILAALILSFCVVDGQITHGKLSDVVKVPATSATETTLPSPGTGQTIGNLSNLVTIPGTIQEPAQSSQGGTSQNPVTPINQKNDFDRYQITYWNDLPQIDCFMGEGMWVGRIMFYTNNTQNEYVNHIFKWPYTDLAGNTSVMTLVVLYYPVSQFENVMNILRYSNNTLTLQIVDTRGALVSTVKQLGQ